jgi:hypothetical protein
MKKEELRKEYFKLRNKGHTNNQCRKILFAKFNFGVNIRTLRRWTNKLYNTDWNYLDKSRRPKTIHRKITKELEEKVISIKKSTGWGAEKIKKDVSTRVCSEIELRREKGYKNLKNIDVEKEVLDFMKKLNLF